MTLPSYFRRLLLRVEDDGLTALDALVAQHPVELFTELAKHNMGKGNLYRTAITCLCALAHQHAQEAQRASRPNHPSCPEASNPSTPGESSA